MGRIKQVVIFEVDNGERHFQNGTFTFSNLYLLHNKIETVCNTLKILVSLIIPLCQSALQSLTRKIKTKFASAEELDKLITHYFEWIEGEYQIEQKEIKGDLKDVKVWIREPEPPTIAGLAFHLGFSNLGQMERHEAKGKYSKLLQRARLHFMAEYEKKLLNGSSSSAIFALRGLGWNDRDHNKPPETTNITLKTELITSGPPLASSERDVIL